MGNNDPKQVSNTWGCRIIDAEGERDEVRELKDQTRMWKVERRGQYRDVAAYIEEKLRTVLPKPALIEALDK